MKTDSERYEQAKLAYNALIKFYPFTLDDLDGEEWRTISGYEDHYQISNFGRVKSLWYGKIKILKPTLALDYLRIDLCDGKRHRHFVIHRLVATAFILNPSNKPQINHKDTCKFNNYVGNLEWCTASENGKHAFFTGLNKNAKGSDDSQAKLTKEQVTLIRLNLDNLSQQQLARKFGVSRKTIRRVLTNETYRNV